MSEMYKKCRAKCFRLDPALRSRAKDNFCPVRLMWGYLDLISLICCGPI